MIPCSVLGCPENVYDSVDVSTKVGVFHTSYGAQVCRAHYELLVHGKFTDRGPITLSPRPIIYGGARQISVLREPEVIVMEASPEEEFD